MQALPILAICDEYNPNFRQVFARVGGDGVVDRTFVLEHMQHLFDAIRAGGSIEPESVARSTSASKWDA